ncbi:MAG: HAD family hydrolase [Lachnospiraceae bacterium]|nr:HAD family hydrolase [Lachnospiraceae bacterium]
MSERRSIISFDLDMTLLDHATYRITDSALEAVERLREHHRIVIASGRDMDNHYSRQYRDLLKPDAIIHMNGTKVTVDGQLIYNHLMQKELLTELLQFSQDHGLSIGVTIGDLDYYTSPEAVIDHDRRRWGTMNRHFMDPWELLNMQVRTLAYIGSEEGVRLLEKQFPQVKFPMFAGKAGADVVEQEASKAEGLKRLCSYWGIHISRTAAFGDSMNDLEILKTAGIGIAMGNSIPELKKEADYVTQEIGQDGVLRACQHFNWFAAFE